MVYRAAPPVPLAKPVPTGTAGVDQQTPAGVSLQTSIGVLPIGVAGMEILDKALRREVAEGNRLRARIADLELKLLSLKTAAEPR